MDKTSKFAAVSTDLVAWVVKQGLRPGQRLPSEQFFADRLGVSRPTVNKAIALLIGQGVLERRGYKLRLVGPPPATTASTDLHLIYAADWSPQFLDGVAHAARVNGVRLQTHDIQSPANEVELYGQLVYPGEQPCLVWPLHAVDHLAPRVAALRRVVVIDLEVPGAPYVASDNLAAGAIAARHLFDLGHRHLAQVIFDPHLNSLRERETGFDTEVLRQRPRRPAVSVTAASRDTPALRTAAAELRRNHPEVTGVFVPTDTAARLFIEAARELGIDVPGDWSVVSHDDDWTAANYDPPQTTVGQDFFQIGAAATSLLYQLTRMTARPRVVPSLRVRPFLVARSTTAPPRQAPARDRS